MKDEAHTKTRFLLLAVPLALAGCMTLNYDAPPKDIAFPGHAKFPVGIELRLSDEVRHAKWEGNPGTVVLGGSIERNCEVLARSLFDEVTVVRSGASESAVGSMASLTPRVVAIARDRPAMGFSDQTTHVLLQWSFADAHGNPVWVETVNGVGTAPLMHADAQVEAALTDVFRKSFDLMGASTEIAAFSTHGRPQPSDVP